MPITAQMKKSRAQSLSGSNGTNQLVTSWVSDSANPSTVTNDANVAQQGGQATITATLVYGSLNANNSSNSGLFLYRNGALVASSSTLPSSAGGDQTVSVSYTGATAAGDRWQMYVQVPTAYNLTVRADSTTVGIVYAATAVPGSESVSSADAASVLAKAGVTDPAALTDVASVRATVPVADTIASSDTATATARHALTEAGAFAEMGVRTPPDADVTNPSGDASSSTDGALVRVLTPAQDVTGTGTDNAAIKATVAAVEAAIMADLATVLAKVIETDTGATTDTAVVSAKVSSTDVAMPASDGSTVFVRIIVTDTGEGVETAFVTSPVPAGDGGATTEGARVVKANIDKRPTSAPALPIEVFGIDTRYAEKDFVGDYLYAKVQYTWGLVPGLLTFKITDDHPLVPTFLKCRRKVIPVRTMYHGREWAGRVMSVEADFDSETGQEIITVTCADNRVWLLSLLAWVNPQFPAEVQIGLTGKQDIMFGPWDWVAKWFVSRNAIRADIPVYCSLPVHANNPALPTLKQLFNLDELLSYVNGLDIVALSARFPYLNELFKQTVENNEGNVRMDLVIPDEWTAQGRTLPLIFNTAGFAQLQSIIDYTSENFLNVGKLFDAGARDKWTPYPTEPSYIFDTELKRDRRHMVWQLRGGQITGFNRKVSHATGSHVIVGGKAPEALNMLVEFAANLVIQAIAGAITAAFGLPGLGAIAVGDAFDNIFFAFQHFYDAALAADLGRDGLKENMADNTAAWSLDSFSTGMQTLRKYAGSDDLTFTVNSGIAADGYEFGDDMEIINGIPVDFSARRYHEGDVMNYYHKGTFVENFVSQVDIEDARDGRVAESVSFGSMTQKDPWAKLFQNVGDVFGITRAFAVSS